MLQLLSFLLGLLLLLIWAKMLNANNIMRKSAGRTGLRGAGPFRRDIVCRRK